MRDEKEQSAPSLRQIARDCFIQANGDRQKAAECLGRAVKIDTLLQIGREHGMDVAVAMIEPLAANAIDSRIRKAYRDLLKECHPVAVAERERRGEAVAAGTEPEGLRRVAERDLDFLVRRGSR